MIPEFRAWDKKNEIFTNYQICDGLLFFFNKHTGCWKKDNEGKRFVLMQSTALKDKNSVEIYEGDIVKIYSEFGDEVVTVNFNGLEFYLQSIDPFKHMDPDIVDESLSDLDLDLEVIGNVYENKELLE